MKLKAICLYTLPCGYSFVIVHDGKHFSGRQRFVLAVISCIQFLLSIIGEAAKFCMAIGLALAFIYWLMLPATARAASPTIPKAAPHYKALLVGNARAGMGFDAPIALLAAQIHQESRWNENAVSGAGAQGLAQFMPATARWLPEVAPGTGNPMPFNPAWAIRALVAYDGWLFDRITHAASHHDRWAFTLCAYNGGLGWVNRDRAKGNREGYDPSRYWGSVEYVNAGRSAANFRENREYPRRIFVLQELYEAAGWGRGVHRDD